MKDPMSAWLADDLDGATTQQGSDTQRTYRRDLVGLNPDGSACEACGRHMHDHDWADLDPNGFVVTCDFEEKA